MRLYKNQLFTPENKLYKAYQVIKKVKLNPYKTAQELRQYLAFLVLFMALIALSCSPIFTKLSEAEISANATIFHRLWIATIILTFWQQANLSSQERDHSPLEVLLPLRNYKQQGLLILASLAATASALCWAWSLTQTSVASSTVLRSLTPLFIAVGGWLVFQQTCDRKFIIGMILAMVGGIAISWDDLQLGTEYLRGDGLALLSAALHGVNLLVAGHLRDRLDTWTILFWRCACGAVVMLPFVWFTEASLFPISGQTWLLVIALAVVCQTLGQGLLVYSLKQFSSSFVAIFMLLKPVVSAILAWMILAENLSIFNAAAVIFILIGIYFAKSSKSSEKSTH